MTYLLPLIVLAGIGVWLLTPDERRRLLRTLGGTVEVVLHDALRGAPGDGEFRAVLRARTHWTPVVPALVLLNLAIYLRAAWAPGPLADPDSLRAWGANYAPLTTNGEWWRLVTSLFLHAGALHLLATIAGLVPLGLLLERWVGPVAFAAVYAASGLMAGLAGLYAQPVDVVCGATGAVLGVQGLLIASVLWALVRRPPFGFPTGTMKVTALTSGLFLLYTAASGWLGLPAATAAFATGFVGGMALARGVSERKPPVRRVAATAVATVVIALISAIPLRGLVNVLPELDRAASFETRTAADYQEAVAQFRKGWKSSDDLAALIDGRILPELRAERVRLTALGRVPQEHEPLVAAAAEYFALREQAWQRRSEGLRTSSLRKLQEAENIERAALEALARMRSR